MLCRSVFTAVSAALFWIPLYATIVIAAKMAMTMITISSSTIVKPCWSLLLKKFFATLIFAFSILDLRGDDNLKMKSPPRGERCAVRAGSSWGGLGIGYAWLETRAST